LTGARSNRTKRQRPVHDSDSDASRAPFSPCEARSGMAQG